MSQPEIQLCSFLTGWWGGGARPTPRSLRVSRRVCVTVHYTRTGRAFLLLNESPVESPPLLNLNVSIINSRHRKILKASLPLVCEGKHLYWIIALRLITMPAITNTHARAKKEEREGKKVTHMHTTHRGRAFVEVCCSGGKPSSLAQVATTRMTRYKEASIRFTELITIATTSDCIGNSLECDNHTISVCAQHKEVNSFGGLGAETPVCFIPHPPVLSVFFLFHNLCLRSLIELRRGQRLSCSRLGFLRRLLIPDRPAP